MSNKLKIMEKLRRNPPPEGVDLTIGDLDYEAREINMTERKKLIDALGVEEANRIIAEQGDFIE